MVFHSFPFFLAINSITWYLSFLCLFKRRDDTNIRLRILFSNTLTLSSSLNIKDHISQSYRTTENIIGSLSQSIFSSSISNICFAFLGSSILHKFSKFSIPGIERFREQRKKKWWLYWWGGHCCPMHCDLSKTYCASPNLGIIMTWICRLNLSQRPIFSGLRFFNKPEISQLGTSSLKFLLED